MVTAGRCLCQQTEGALGGVRHEDSEGGRRILFGRQTFLQAAVPSPYHDFGS
jgi:hypothetical protein